MGTYNGFEPDEVRVRKVRPHKADNGHSLVEFTKERVGAQFKFHYAVKCECGKRFSGKTEETPLATHDRHLQRSSREVI
jgi:hypothetical protein